MKSKSNTKAPAKKTAVRPCAARKTCAKKPVAKPATKSVTFTVHADQGKTVYLAGEFNQWNPTARKMTFKAKDGIYATTIRLAAGTYQYKFVIDGTWCADPENVNSVPNDQGTFNSVIEVR